MLSLEELNQSRTQGFRPSVVCCCINENKVLILFNKEYNFWMFPQGGIENKENAETAIVRALESELGKGVSEDCDKSFILLGDQFVEFAPGKHNITELKTDEGTVVEPKGKRYYFFAIYKKTANLDINQTQFSDFFWVTYKAGSFLAAKIPQKGKKRITLKALNLLKERNLVE
jgi:8-oxo-dGTP pyrophosphatase MutT (NUDIX family)